MSAPASPSASEVRPGQTPTRLPASDVSSMVGILGLAGLLSWIAFCRYWPEIAGAVGVPGVHIRLSGPKAALFGLVMSALPMVIWSVFVDKVHLRASTGLDWSLRKTRSRDSQTTRTKIIGLWVTWAVIGGLYVMGRWYWQGGYGFALTVIGYAIIPAALLSIPYVRWIDGVMVNPRDHSWHFGALLLRQEGWEWDEVKKHWRSWIIKGFFTAFMLSIVPAGFAYVVNADLQTILSNPAIVGILLIELLFVIDVQIGTVGYVLTNRPLDAHIRSGNPFLGGWVAAMICYPPLVWGIIGNGMVLGYENQTRDWTYWLAGNEILLWGWAAWLVLLTAIYAAATVVFGMRFSNLTYRGVITHGPFKYTRHPAYLSKNIFWWCSVMPFLVTSDSMADAVRNVFALLCVNAIYYWRAKTEEAHLLAEDPKYREYHAWMEENGVITAPLDRLGKRLMLLFSPT
ncbi:methyltransferase family protein [Erythrobacter sp. W53]|uniref:methyltransferase family protein n=1 Tax=Erythrobacter sp. W53 TaxID=3425947 RepID=UPI003D768543